MTLILEGLGFLIILLGAASADSQYALIPGILIGVGILMMLSGYWSERRYY